MHVNEGYDVGIMKICPQGTNSTMFTECCGAAITDSETKCPSCKRDVIGHDAESDHERGKIRWKNATSLWKRNKSGERI